MTGNLADKRNATDYWKCEPVSLMSWNFQLRSSAGHSADINLNWMGEQGNITYDGQMFRVSKQGLFSGNWILEHAGMAIVDAIKPNAMTRRFELRYDDVMIELIARSPFTRCYDIHMNDHRVGTIDTVGLFSRRAILQCSDDVPPPVQLMCFWLTVLTWRRAANNS